MRLKDRRISLLRVVQALIHPKTDVLALHVMKDGAYRDLFIGQRELAYECFKQELFKSFETKCQDSAEFSAVVCNVFRLLTDKWNENHPDDPLNLNFLPVGEKPEHPDPALAVIQYVLGENVDDAHAALHFIQLWNDGDFDILRDNWDNIPNEVFIGADPLFKPESTCEQDVL